MEEQQLQQLVEKISIEYFQKPFRHRAIFNNRLRTTGGRYLLGSHNIELNRKYLDEHGIDELVGIIKHELCHYHLHLEGKGYQHRDADFRLLLSTVGAPRFCTPLKTNKSVSKTLTYKCSGCSNVFIRKKRINTNRYVCGKCGGKIILVKQG